MTIVADLKKFISGNIFEVTAFQTFCNGIEIKTTKNMNIYSLFLDRNTIGFLDFLEKQSVGCDNRGIKFFVNENTGVYSANFSDF